MRNLRSLLPFLLLAIVTFAAYWNAWPEALVLDDKKFAGQERFADLSRLPEFFQESVWATTGYDDKLYRPLLLVSFAIDATLFADRAAVWHLVNVLLHVLATLLVCLLLLRLLRLSEPQGDSPVLIAVLAAVVFGVHPVHAEVVNSIFNRSILFVTIGSTAGLWWLLSYLDSRPVLAWTGIWLAYWLVLFSRETGADLDLLERRVAAENPALSARPADGGAAVGLPSPACPRHCAADAAGGRGGGRPAGRHGPRCIRRLPGLEFLDEIGGSLA
jgi:hypothetical protein